MIFVGINRASVNSELPSLQGTILLGCHSARSKPSLKPLGDMDIVSLTPFKLYGRRKQIMGKYNASTL